MDYYLFNIKNNKIVKIKEDDVLDKLYFLECRPLTTNEINKFKKSKDVSKDIIDFLKSDSPEKIIDDVRIAISKIENKTFKTSGWSSSDSKSMRLLVHCAQIE